MRNTSLFLVLALVCCNLVMECVEARGKSSEEGFSWVEFKGTYAEYVNCAITGAKTIQQSASKYLKVASKEGKGKDGSEIGIEKIVYNCKNLVGVAKSILRDCPAKIVKKLICVRTIASKAYPLVKGTLGTIQYLAQIVTTKLQPSITDANKDLKTRFSNAYQTMHSCTKKMEGGLLNKLLPRFFQ